MTAIRRVAVLIFDGVEVLDFAGPFEAFSVTNCNKPPLPFDAFTVARDTRPVMARNNLSINPDYDFDGCPEPSVLVIPGGPGTRREMYNPSVLDFVRHKVDQAELVLSVCTGALLLAKAGLLDGLQATTHFGAMDELRAMAPKTQIHPDARGVDNGKIILSTGVSAGIDMALYAIGRLLGSDTAAETAHYMQYEWRYRDPDNSEIVRAAA